jgi:hypothetical protein
MREAKRAHRSTAAYDRRRGRLRDGCDHAIVSRVATRLASVEISKLLKFLVKSARQSGRSGTPANGSEIDFEARGANPACANREPIGEFAILEKGAI